jgi:Protein of unknown function (DUF2752)
MSPRKSDVMRSVVVRIAPLTLLVCVIKLFVGGYAPPCLTRMIIHVPCPGCGFSRSLLQLLNGNLKNSFRYHPMTVPTIVFAVIYALSALFSPLVAQRIREGKYCLYLACAFLFVWLARMLLNVIGLHWFLW